LRLAQENPLGETEPSGLHERREDNMATPISEAKSYQSELRATFEHGVLSKALAEAMKVSPSRATLPILGAVKIATDDGLATIEATDLEVSYRRLIGAKVESWGQVAVPGRLLANALKRLPKGSEVTLQSSEGSLTVESELARLSISTYPVEDFPHAEEVSGGYGIATTTDKVRDLLSTITIPASTDEARPVLTGVQFSLEADGLRLAATDSYRLGVIQRPGQFSASDPQQFIVPARAVALWTKLTGRGDEGELFIQLAETHAEFSSPTLRITTRMIQGEFPNWRQLVPDGHPNVLRGDIGALKEAVQAAATVAEGNTPIRLHLGPELKATATESGVGEMSVPIQAAHYDGEEMVAAFNPKFFIDGLDFIAAGRVKIEFADPLKPVIFRPDGIATRDALYLLMPVRLSR
jgi:DNA polymerase-3 subunit beta